jgi:hypothetical protein
MQSQRITPAAHKFTLMKRQRGKNRNDFLKVVPEPKVLKMRHLMTKIENLQNVWDNGAISSANLSVEETLEFKKRTNAQHVVARKWLYDGKEYQTPHQVRPLQDCSGLVHYENDDTKTMHLVVLNGDGTERVVIGVPRLDHNSRPEKGYLSLPPSPARFGGIEWGCEGNDGCTDYLFEFDWVTGALLRYARPSHSW